MSTELRRVVRTGTPGGTLLVLLHGLGSNENDLMGLAPYLPREITVVCLRAPMPYGMGGYSWFDIEWRPEGKWIDVDAADRHRRLLVDVVTGLRKEFTPSRLILGGFSQGAMMTLGTVCLRPDLVDRALMMSGRGIDAWIQDADAALVSVPFLVQHGQFDEVIELEEARTAVSQLRERGVTTDFREYPMGHEVSMPSLEDLVAWLA